MRKTKLLSATALTATLALLMVAGIPGQALAATTISTATTAPVVTSTTGDLTVDSAGSITLTSGTAITVDSNNTVTVNGTVDLSKSANNSTGILINGGHTSGLTIGGTIKATGDFTQTDTNSDTFNDGPFSDANTRYGIHSLGATSFVGDVSVASGSTITVSGEHSYGIRFENNIQGAFSYKGTTSIEGNNDTGISLESGVTGNVYLSGNISAHGQNASAVSLSGLYGGAVEIDGTYTSTGYATTASLTAAQLKIVMGMPNDLYQSGPTVSIGGNVANGILINAKPIAVSTSTSTDQDGDGVADSGQLTAAITSYSSAPALRIGSAAGDMTVGGLVYNSSAVNPPAVRYGLLIRGGVTGSSLYSGFNSTGVQIGGLGHGVAIANGIGVNGQVVSRAFGGTATALLIGGGATTPQLDVGGTINATGASATTSDGAATPTYTTVPAGAYAVDINGGTLPAINVAAGGGIYAVGQGSTTSATAIRDQSDSLTTITNKNIISATISASDDNGDGTAETVQNRGIAIDTHTNTVGLTITQTDTAPTDDTIAAPYILGDILLGSGNDTISSNGGTISGNIDFGAGSNSFILDGGAVYIGKMTGSGTVNMDIVKGKAGFMAGSVVNLTNLHVGASSTLGLTLDVDHPTQAMLNGTGTAVFDSGATLNLSLNKVLTAPSTFTLLNASSITLNGLNSASFNGEVPYIYHADLSTNSTNTTLFAAFRMKTQAEAGYSDNQYSALVPVLTAIGGDAGASAALLSTFDKSTFDSFYNQYLPDYSGENLITLSLGAESLNRSLGALTSIPDNNQGQWWFQEYGFKTDRKYGETAGFHSTGFSFSGGRETQLYGNQMVGLYMSYTASTPNDTFAISKENMSNSDITFGGYWRLKSGPVKSWAHIGAGYTHFDSTRNLLAATVAHTAKGKWSGSSMSAGMGTSVDFKAGPIGVTPAITADYYKLSENKHSETGGGDYFDLNVGQRNGHLLSSSALVNISYNKLFLKPELWFGYKENLSAEIPDTVVNFANGTPFTLTGGNLKGGGPVAGFRVSADNQYSYFGLEADYEKQNDYNNLSVALRARFQF